MGLVVRDRREEVTDGGDELVGPGVRPHVVRPVAPALGLERVRAGVELVHLGRHESLPDDRAVEDGALLQRREPGTRVLLRRAERRGRDHQSGAARGEASLGQARRRAEQRELHVGRQAALHVHREPEDGVELVERVDVRTPEHRLRPLVDVERVPRDDAEEAAAGTPDGPEHVGIRRLVGVDDLPRGGHDVDGAHACARGAVQPPVPAEPSLQQVATDAHGRAVASGKEQPVRAERRAEVLSPDARLHRRGA